MTHTDDISDLQRAVLEHQERIAELQEAAVVDHQALDGARKELSASMQGIARHLADLPILTLTSRCDGLDRKTTAAEMAIQSLDRQLNAALDGFRLEANTRYNEIKALRQSPPPVEMIEPMVLTIANRYLEAIPAAVESRLADLPKNVAELVRRQLAASPQGFDLTSVEPFELSATYKRGQLVNVRGSTYVVLKQTTGVFPERGNVRGPGTVGSPVFALIASAGAAGLNTGGGGNVSSNGALTLNRVPYVGAGGMLIDSANLTFNGTSLFFGAATPGSITGSAGALTLAGAGTDQPITLFPSGTGPLKLVSSDANNVAMEGYINTSTIVFDLQRTANNVIISARKTGDGIIFRANGTTEVCRLLGDATGVQMAGTKSLFFGATALASIKVSADTTAAILTFTAPASGSFSFVGAATFSSNITLAGDIIKSSGELGIYTATNSAATVMYGSGAGQSYVKAYGSTHATKANVVEIGSGSALAASFNASQQLTLSSLAGTGTRAVVVDANGKLSAP